jgi:amino acid permease
MGSAIIEIISSLVEISGNATLDTILFAIIAFISFSIAFGLVGAIFDALGFYDSDLMSDTHWVIRVAVFALITWILVKVFQFFAWLLSFQWWVYVIAILLIVTVVLITYAIKYKYRKNVNEPSKNIAESNSEGIEKGEEIPKANQSYVKYKCPRCGSKLVKRHGPFGDFVGCSSYPKCHYTRSRF